ncbi:hypothetical protein CBS101457_003951 [Exobasidium rhododendri]|nr:hypothetical protein CBS101457_003951 [Exobasidium rhododendri]
MAALTTEMSAADSLSESTSFAKSPKDDIAVSLQKASLAPSQPPYRQRVRTREISSGSSSPIKATREALESWGTGGFAKTTTSSAVQLDHPADDLIRQSPSRRASHQRSSSAVLPSEATDYRARTMHNQDNVTASSSTTSKTLGRRSSTVSSPPNSWVQRNLQKRYEEQIPHSPSISNKASRGRSDSVGSFASSDNVASWQDDMSETPEPPRNVATFKPTSSQKSFSTVPSEGDSSRASEDYGPSGKFQSPASDTVSDNIYQREKRKLFGKTSEQLANDPIGTNKGGMLRKVGSRGFFGGSKDRDQDFNASTDTLASISSTSTARMELARKAGAALSTWSRRSKNKGLLRRGSGLSRREDTIYQNGEGSSVSSDGGHASMTEEYTDLTSPQKRRDMEGDTSYITTEKENVESAINGADSQERGDGFPKRLSGWLSNMLVNSVSTTPLHERDDRLLVSDSSSTMKRKTSAISLSKAVNSDPATEVFAASTQDSSSNALPRARNTGLLSTLSSSGRNRAETTSSATSGGARSGFDRALRYFIDSGDYVQSQEEGIWLLGVWHGPQELSQSAGQASGPSIEVSPTSPSKFSVAEVKSERALTPEREQLHPGTSSTPIRTPTGLPRVSAASHVLFRQQLDRSSSLPHMTSFQSDFSSRIWCTYRSHFTPITRDGSISKHAETAAAEAAAAGHMSSHSAEVGLHQEASETSAAISTSTGHTKDWKKKSTGVSAYNELNSSSTSQLSPWVSTMNATTLPSSLPFGAHNAVLANQGNAIVSIGSGLGDKMGFPGLWSRATAAAQSYGLAGRAGLTTDAGWGCMLRTGQSLLANALLNVHLGRKWRRGEATDSGPATVDDDRKSVQARQDEYVKYVRLLSWFMDEPSSACPFGVHRMAREGKRLGKEIGEWFGPSTAAGAIKKLVDDFPEAGIGVSLATDGVIYLNQVKAQAQVAREVEDGKNRSASPWDRPVLILIGVRLGLDGVHPMYHDSIKAIFSFPQSVGIAGGRPSSSYYFVGYQGDSLFYLDPHHVRATVPFRHPPPAMENDKDWWTQAFSEADLSSYHSDRPKRMPMKSLDPSMLLGFLIKDQSSLRDFVDRVKALPRPIFSVLESMPKWMMEDDEGLLHEDERALESFSESSVEEAMADKAGDGAPIAKVPQQQQQDSEHLIATGASKEPLLLLEKSMISSQTITTPPSEGTFEFIDRQAASTLAPQSTPRELQNHHVFLNGHSEDVQEAECDPAKSIHSAAITMTKPGTKSSDGAVGGYSFTDSDSGSAWVQLDNESNEQREQTSSLPVEASSTFVS